MKLIAAEMIDALAARADESQRRRAHHNMHEQLSDPIQRLFVAANRDSYFRPHRHAGKWELALVVRGRFDVFTFNDTGTVLMRCTLGPDTPTLAVEIPANTWHVWLPLENGSVFLEVKQGPYDPQNAAEFAPWSPAEGVAQATVFSARLRGAQPGDCLA